MIRFKILFIICLFISACTNTERLKAQAKKVDIIAVADKYAGLHEKTNNKELKTLLKVDPVITEWCAAFVNAILHSQDIPGSDAYSKNPYMARSFLKWGKEVENPLLGDIIVFPREKPWEGHVGFYVASYEENGISYYIILGGNQSDYVSYQAYKANTAISIRRHNL